MSVKAMQWVFEQRFEPTDLSIMIVLADRANENDQCYPGHDSILERVNIGRRTLVRRLASLEERGYISRDRRVKPNGARTSDLYTLSLGANLARAAEAPSKVPPMALTDESSVETTGIKKGAGAEAKRGSRLPDGWMPSPGVASAIREECPGVDLTKEHRKFADYWKGVPGARGVKLDWDATWRNWMRNACERAAKINPYQMRVDLDAQWRDFLNESPPPRLGTGVIYCQKHDGYPVPCDRCARDAEDAV
jgi:hypothetical protein